MKAVREPYEYLERLTPGRHLAHYIELEGVKDDEEKDWLYPPNQVIRPVALRDGEEGIPFSELVVRIDVLRGLENERLKKELNDLRMREREADQKMEEARIVMLQAQSQLGAMTQRLLDMEEQMQAVLNAQQSPMAVLQAAQASIQEKKLALELETRAKMREDAAASKAAADAELEKLAPAGVEEGSAA